MLKEKQKFDPWLEQGDDTVAANVLILLSQRATGLLGRQLTRLESDFVASGGIREKMTAVRLEARVESESPACPDCGAAMLRRRSAKGPFWGCSHDTARDHPEALRQGFVHLEVRLPPRDHARGQLIGQRRFDKLPTS